MSDDEALYAQIRAAQAIAVEKLQQSWGMSAEQVATARASLAAFTPNTATAENLATAWGRSAEHQARSLGIEPVSDAEAAEIQAAMDAAVAEKQAARAAELDDQLRHFRAERDIGRNTPGHLYYVDPLAPTETVMDSATGKMVSYSRRAQVEALLEKTETALIEARLEAGLPAEPTARRTPAQVAQERYDARPPQGSVMKFHRELKIGDVVGLLGLHEAYPKMGVVRAIDGDVVGVHWTTGGAVFHGCEIHDQTLWVNKSSIFDTRCWAGWLKAFWRALK
jgi:hypothetical protein